MRRSKGEQALETIQLTLGQIYTVISATAVAVAGAAWWVWKIVDGVKKAARTDLDGQTKKYDDALAQQRKDMSEEMAKGIEMLIKIMDSRKSEARIENEKIWTRLENIRDNAVHKSDLRDMEAKFDKKFDTLIEQMSKIVVISEKQVNHDVRLKNIEDIMKMD